MAMRGWRRIGIILSVIWFLGFGVFLFEEAVRYVSSEDSRSSGYCYSALARSFDRLQYISDAEKRKREEAANDAVYEQCMAASLDRRVRNDPINNISTTGAAILGIDLATIGLGWLIVWGCIALGRWVHRGFAEP